MFFLGLREVLSMVFCGWTPMDAGVNCVRDQCMAVVYLRVYIYITIYVYIYIYKVVSAISLLRMMARRSSMALAGPVSK